MTDESIDRMAEELFWAWWNKDGRYIDPDTSDVPWYDKRQDFAHIAFQHAFRKAMEINGEPK